MKGYFIMIDWEKVQFKQECRDICDSNTYEPESEKCINCLYCRECIYEYEYGYECLWKHFCFDPEDGIPEKPCLKS